MEVLIEKELNKHKIIEKQNLKNKKQEIREMERFNEYMKEKKIVKLIFKINIIKITQN